MFRRNRRGREPRVLIIVQNLPVPLDRRVWLESQALRDAGYGVSVICPRGPQDSKFEVLDGIRIHRYRPAPATHGIVSFVWEFAYCWLVSLWLAAKIFVRDGFDVIQACNPPDTFWALALLFRPLGVRFVFDQHDLCPEVYDARFEKPNPVLARGLHLLERASYKTAHHIIVTNALYRGIALERGRLDPADVTVVRNGPIADRFVKGEPDESLRRGRKYLCCYLGIMGPQDGVELIVQVAQAVRARGRNDVQFTLLGFGDELDNLEAMAASLGVDDCIEFTGRANDDMVRSWLSTADLGIVPDPKTPFNDVSSMNKTVEYMAFGLPVVAFDLRETMATADAAGAYVPQSDAESFATVLLEVLDDRQRREKMATFGRDKFVRELAWHDQATKYVEVYDALRDARRA